MTSPTDPACRFLEVHERVGNVVVFACGKYDEIIRDPSSDISPAFGAGCCMPLFNSARRQNLVAIELGIIQRPFASS